MKPYLLLAVALMAGCQSKPAHKLADEETLRRRCAQLNVTCDIQWKYDSRTWMASAVSTDRSWWFAHEATRALAIDKLNEELGGSPTNPADPPPETIYKAKEAH
jgi:hypothetical protein